MASTDKLSGRQRPPSSVDAFVSQMGIDKKDICRVDGLLEKIIKEKGFSETSFQYGNPRIQAQDAIQERLSSFRHIIKSQMSDEALVKVLYLRLLNIKRRVPPSSSSRPKRERSPSPEASPSPPRQRNKKRFIEGEDEEDEEKKGKKRKKDKKQEKQRGTKDTASSDNENYGSSGDEHPTPRKRRNVIQNDPNNNERLRYGSGISLSLHPSNPPLELPLPAPPKSLFISAWINGWEDERAFFGVDEILMDPNNPNSISYTKLCRILAEELDVIDMAAYELDTTQPGSNHGKRVAIRTERTLRSIIQSLRTGGNQTLEIILKSITTS